MNCAGVQDNAVEESLLGNCEENYCRQRLKPDHCREWDEFVDSPLTGNESVTIRSRYSANVNETWAYITVLSLHAHNPSQVRTYKHLSSSKS